MSRAPLTSQKKALSAYRRRMKRTGLVRLEVKVRKQDAALVRRVVTALADPAHGVAALALLHEHFGPSKPHGLKALLAAAPLDGLDLDRAPDLGRPVDL